MTNGALTDDDSPNPNDLSDVTQQAVNDAIEQLGTTDPDAIKEWLVEHGYVTNNIPAGADWSPGVNNDDIKTPVTNIGRFDAWTGVKGPVSVVTEWPESQTFQSAFEALQDANDPVDGGAFRDWVTIAQQLESHTQEFRSRFSAVDGWDGKSADALKANVAAFTDPASGPAPVLTRGIEGLSFALATFDDILSATKNYIVPNWKVYQDSLTRWPQHHDEIVNEFNSFAQSVLARVYVPLIQGLAAKNPAFTSGSGPDLGPNNTDAPPPPPNTDDLKGPPPPPNTDDAKGPPPPPNMDDAKGPPPPDGAPPPPPSLDNANLANPNLGDPNLANPNLNNPDLSNLSAANPNLGGPNFNAPDLGDPNFSAPNISDPNAADPNFASPNANDPSLTDPNFSEPTLSDPNLADPNLGDPNVASPNFNNPSLSDPTFSDPNLGDPNGLFPPSGLGGAAGGLGGLSSGLGSVGDAAGGPAGAAKSLLNDPSQSGVAGLGSAADGAQQALGAAERGTGGLPEGALGLGPKGLNGLDNAGSPHVGGGGGAGVGARGLDLSKPAGAPVAAANRGVDLADSARPGIRGAQEASAAGGSGGAPSGGGGGGGQRGPSGKEHKANKALRHKKNGELVFGNVDAVVPVLGDDQPDHEVAGNANGQEAARQPAGAQRSPRPQQGPRFGSGAQPGQSAAGS